LAVTYSVLIARAERYTDQKIVTVAGNAEGLLVFCPELGLRI
jgi:hypothetical protein